MLCINMMIIFIYLERGGGKQEQGLEAAQRRSIGEEGGFKLIDGEGKFVFLTARGPHVQSP